MRLSSVPLSTILKRHFNLKAMYTPRVLRLGLCLLLSILADSRRLVVYADRIVPPGSEVVTEDTGGYTLDAWKDSLSGDLSLAPGGRCDGLTGPPVAVGQANDLWVDAVYGDDANDGLTAATAFRSIQKAADLASPGTTLHIMPGIYRETVWPAMSGSPTQPIVYVAEDGPGTAIIRGSEPAASLAWTQLRANTIGLPPGVDPTNVYYADLSTWGLDGPPRFVVESDGNGEVVTRLPLAREPDWQVVTEWKHYEFWWAADGGWDVAGCNPATDLDPDCDLPWRSAFQLTDHTDDIDPAGIEPGNLTTLGDLTGATLVAVDTMRGHYIYRRTIAAHDVLAGRVTVDRVAEYGSGSGNPGLGWGSKYYVEGKPCLLDTPGEWWYDINSECLYLWPHRPGNPATMNIEISQRDHGFRLKNRSYTVLDGLTIELLNESAIYQYNYHANKSYGNTVRNVTLRYANRGVFIEQSARADTPASSATDGFTLEDSEIAYMDSQAIVLNDWWENGADPDTFTRSRVLNTLIRNNELHHLGFHADGDSVAGSVFRFANKLRFEGNHIHHIAHNGVGFSRSVIQSSKEYGFTPDEIKTGEIIVKDNVFEDACQQAADCGALKFWGDPPDNHVFRDVLVTGNVFRNTLGWAYVAEKREHWVGGTGSDVQGMGGFGLYVDEASGIHAYRNIAYNNAYAGFVFAGVWRDGDIVFYNNIAANSLSGFHLGGLSFDTHGSVNTQVVNNILVNNEGYGIRQNDADGVYDNTVIDHNLYYNNGWRPYEDGGVWKAGAMFIYRGSDLNEYFPTLADIQAHTAWETQGMEGDAGFRDYDPAEHNLRAGSWPDFQLTAASTNAIDRGTAALPASLTALLVAFGVDDHRWGTAFDIGAFEYEHSFFLRTKPSARAISPGGVATYMVEVRPVGCFTATVALVTASPSPSLTLSLVPTAITPPANAVLTITDTRVNSTLMPGLWYVVPISGAGGGFTQSVSAKLLVGGTRAYLPLTTRKG